MALDLRHRRRAGCQPGRAGETRRFLRADGCPRAVGGEPITAREGRSFADARFLTACLARRWGSAGGCAPCSSMPDCIPSGCAFPGVALLVLPGTSGEKVSARICIAGPKAAVSRRSLVRRGQQLQTANAWGFVGNLSPAGCRLRAPPASLPDARTSTPTEAWDREEAECRRSPSTIAMAVSRGCCPRQIHRHGRHQ